MKDRSLYEHAIRTAYEFSQARTQHEHLEDFRKTVSELSEGICPQCHEPIETIRINIGPLGSWGKCVNPDTNTLRCYSLKRIITDERGIVQQLLYPDFMVETFEVKNKLYWTGPDTLSMGYIDSGGEKIPYNTAQLETVEVHMRIIVTSSPINRIDGVEITLGNDTALQYKVKD